MKTRKLFAAALALPMLFACTKENIVPSEKPAQGDKYDFTINVIPAENETKAFFSDENGIYWDNVAKKGGIINVSNKYESTEMSHYHYPEGEGVHNQASFKFSAAEGDYRFFYPYHSESTFDKIIFEVDTYQTTGVGASSDVFSVISKDLVSLTTNSDLAADTKYQVVGSYIQFLVYGKENEQVKSIAVKCDENSRISGQYYVDGKNNSLTGVYYNGQDLVLDLLGASCPTTLDKESAKGLYAAILPSSTDFKTAKNTYVVTTDGGIYTFESKSGKEFDFGSIKTIPLNLTKFTSFSKTPEHLYIIGGATQAGWDNTNPIELTKVDGTNQFKGENIRLTAGEGDSGFKFLTTKGSWSKVYVNGLHNNKTITYYEDPERAGNDTKFYVEKDGFYTVTVDFDTNEIKCEASIPQFKTTAEAEWVDMKPTSKPGVYKHTRWFGSGQYNHDFRIKLNGKYYHPENSYPQINFKDNAEFVKGLNYDTVSDDNADGGWWIDDAWTNKCHIDVVFDVNTGKVTVKYAQGEKFWLIGNPFGGYNGHVDSNPMATIDENGIAKWENLVVTSTGDFKICGENRLSSAFYDWRGEWYNSDSKDYEYGASWSGQPSSAIILDGNDNKWIIKDTGTYDVEFDTVNLKLTVTKK